MKLNNLLVIFLLICMPILAFADDVTWLPILISPTSIIPSSDYFDSIHCAGSESGIRVVGASSSTTIQWAAFVGSEAETVTRIVVEFDGFASSGNVDFVIWGPDSTETVYNWTDLELPNTHELSIPSPENPIYYSDAVGFDFIYGLRLAEDDSIDICNLSVTIHYESFECPSLVDDYEPYMWLNRSTGDSGHEDVVIGVQDPDMAGWRLIYDCEWLNPSVNEGTGNESIILNVFSDLITDLEPGEYPCNIVFYPDTGDCPPESLLLILEITSCPTLFTLEPIEFSCTFDTDDFHPENAIIGVFDHYVSDYSIECDSTWITIEDYDSFLVIYPNDGISALPVETYHTQIQLIPDDSLCGVSSVPVRLEITPYIVDFTLGESFSIFVDDDGYAHTSGENSWGQLGLMDTIDRTTPTPVPGARGIIYARTGADHTLVQDEMGHIYSWGRNTNGELGDPDFRQPKRLGIMDSTSTWYPPLEFGDAGIKQFECGRNFSAALDSNGYVWVWGSNSHGQLAQPLYVEFLDYPVRIDDYRFQEIALGDNFFVGVKLDSTVKVWGNNYFGQLGIGIGSDSIVSSPNHIYGLDNIVDIECGENHTIAVNSDGQLFVWGRNNMGQLGLPDRGNAFSPMPIPSSTIGNVVSIACGDNHTLAIDSSGDIFSWGSNEQGQLGRNTFRISDSDDDPDHVQISVFDIMRNIDRVEAGGNSSMARDNAGRVWVWGDNSRGQLGLRPATHLRDSLPRPLTNIFDIYSDSYSDYTTPDELYLSVHPNPFNSACVFPIKANSQIEIFSTDGKLVLSDFIVSDKNYIWKPSMKLPSGVYNIKITNPDIEYSSSKAIYLK